MAAEQNAYRGCLLGLAVGDAMGYTVDSQSWREIQENYGPNGLLGYDLVNGYAEITSYTQLAAFTCNGLILGITWGQMKGRMLPYIRYIALSHREWCVSQRPWGRPDKTYCWLMQQPELCRRHCMDTRMMDTINRGTAGAPEEPVNHFQNCGSITAAVGVGLFFDPERMAQTEIDRLGAEAVALSVLRTTHLWMTATPTPSLPRTSWKAPVLTLWQSPSVPPTVCTSPLPSWI